MRVRNDFVALLVNVDQMIEAKKERRYRYTMYEAKESVVFVHVDDFYVIKIRERYSISEKNSINGALHFSFFLLSSNREEDREKKTQHLRIGLIMMMTRCSILLLRL